MGLEEDPGDGEQFMFFLPPNDAETPPKMLIMVIFPIKNHQLSTYFWYVYLRF
jgi:hypothetical protein